MSCFEIFRLEEKLGQLQKKKLVLQNRLAAEKKCIEQLRVQLLQMHEREEDLCSQISRLEGLLQNYEQRNFELEESCIEMKCSVQFVIHSIPLFALCYYGTLLRTFGARSLRGCVSFLLSLPFSFVGDNECRHLEFGKDTTSANKLGPLSTAPDVAGCPVAPSRKHKLRELSASVPGDVEPKLKKLKRILDRTGITCICNCAKCDGSAGGHLSTNDEDGSADVSSIIMSHAEAQTEEKLWKELVEQIFAEQKHEWRRAEKVLLKKIEILECDIDKCQEIFDQERGSLIKMYETKLAEKESQLKETQACRAEKRDLQEKWNTLISELEQFAIYLGKNLSEKASGEEGDPGEDILSMSTSPQPGVSSQSYLHLTGATGPISPATSSSHGNNESGSLSLITTSIIPALRDNAEATGSIISPQTAGKDVGTSEGCEIGCEVEQKTELISYLQNSLREHLSTFEKRERHLLDEIDRLTREIRENANKEEDSEHQGNMIVYLSQENERLTSLFQDQEKVWGDLHQLQEEHEKLKLEVGNIVSLRKKLEDSQKTENEMRDRLEELERAESLLKGQIAQLEKKEQKGLEKIQQLRDEIQFLRTKCCQLQDDIDGRVSRESKYRSEIQALTQKLKESCLELEEKESQLESNETALQTQVRQKSEWW